MAEVTTIQIRGQDKTAAAFKSVNQKLGTFQKKVGSANTGAGLFAGGLGGMAKALGPLVGVAGVGALASKLFDVADRLGKVSAQIGLTVPELQGLQFAASQSGVGTSVFNAALQKFNTNIGDANRGLGPAKKGFEDLGIAITDGEGGIRTTKDLFGDVATAIAAIEDPAGRAAAAGDLFGKKMGVELLPLLTAGEGGIDRLVKKIETAGGIIGTDTVKEVEKFNDQMDIVSRVAFANFAKAVTPLLPVLTFLAANFDNIAKFVGIAGTAFLVAKIPAAIAGITIAVKTMTLAMASNPIGLLAIGVAAAGTAAYSYSDEISDFFGFAGDKKVADNVGETAKALDKTEKELVKIKKVEAKRLKQVNEMAGSSGTIKKNLIPDLTALDQGLGATKTQVTNLLGAEGLGGVQLGFIQFLTNLNINVDYWLDKTQTESKKTVELIYQDFTEMVTGLQNKLVFQRNDISDAFEEILNAFKASIKDTKLEVEAITIDVPSSAFDFSRTVVSVPGDIFDWKSVRGAAGDIDSLVSQIDGLKVVHQKQAQTTYRSAGRVRFSGQSQATNVYTDSGFENVYSASELQGSTSARSVSRSEGRVTTPAQAAADGGGGSTVVVNIYDGTGTKLSAFDSSIRVEILERANRNDQFAALLPRT